MDTYQAVYDAVRSKISGGNIGDVAERVMREAFDMGYLRQHIQQEVYAVSHEQQRPSVLYRPELGREGDMWCALYGPDLHSGVAGFGETPAAAMAAFDVAWTTERTRK